MTYPTDYPGRPLFPTVAQRAKHLLNGVRTVFSADQGKPASRPSLSLASPARTPLAAGDVVLATYFRNERRFLPSFLSHYRRLGVKRFALVDDDSADDAEAFLTPQPDVDLYQSSLSYPESKRGALWRNELLDLYGRDRWYLFVDVDEYLVFDRSETRSLFDLIEALRMRGVSRLCAPMIDMYPRGPLKEAMFDGRDDRMPWTVASGFDAQGYTAHYGKSGWTLKGGVR